MKKAIFERWDSNFADYEWRWLFYLERLTDGSFTLSAEQELIKADEGDEPLEVADIPGLREGADIYESFMTMIASNECGIDLDDIDPVADVVAELDPVVGDQFRRGEELLERRASQAQRSDDARIDALVARHQEAIDELTAGLDHTPEQVGGKSLFSPRDRVRRFLECHLRREEKLPSPEQAIDLVLGAGRLADALSPEAPESWIKVPYRRVSVPRGTGGICPFCGNEFRGRPVSPRWNLHCQCGATLDYLGMAWLSDQ
ncbi:hypothetical protein [Tropicimonas sediminicola]|uniref:Uncharacterized protein n=1 Tax=Tropicimonas sediminicola TaxID=1031541 RepID=A0A239LUB9_9RHOB|nr:hypothetical protein [Tropicimonas sediminicola]SNT33224.1 hypothetical protein SAMN05421757_1112 [Tropicimonas sediminicola]